MTLASTAAVRIRAGTKPRDSNPHLPTLSAKVLSVRPLRLFDWDSYIVLIPTPGIEPGGRMRCAISGMSSVAATLDTAHIALVM